MKNSLNSRRIGFVMATVATVVALSSLQAAPKTKKAAPKAKPKPAAEAVNPIFYDTVWEYRLGTLYGKDKNIVSDVSGEAQFERGGKYHQDYYIGSIGNFFKGTYKLNGRKLTTYDEKGEKIFDYTISVSAAPPVLVLSTFENDGSKSMDFSLRAKPKK